MGFARSARGVPHRPQFERHAAMARNGQYCEWRPVAESLTNTHPANARPGNGLDQDQRLQQLLVEFELVEPVVPAQAATREIDRAAHARGKMACHQITEDHAGTAAMASFPIRMS
ncbi:hypothetical protein [Nocardia sp. NPDC051981]|uniref:hypothetical protein n=1 Tax=Nocardia sp. NPDC051981 TaxID=3155417 RepID=UPI003412AFC5